MPVTCSTQTGGDLETIIKKKIDEPSRYVVLLHNDDYTTMAFVVDILCRIFNKSFDEAKRIMLLVDRTGIGACGVYTREIAETKVSLVRKEARRAGFPLRCTMEKE